MSAKRRSGLKAKGLSANGRVGPRSSGETRAGTASNAADKAEEGGDSMERIVDRRERRRRPPQPTEARPGGQQVRQDDRGGRDLSKADAAV